MTKRAEGWRGAGVVVVLLALTAASSLTSFAEQQGLVVTDPGADADRNKVFDDLDADLAQASEDDRRNVLVLLTEAPDAGTIASLESSIGAFTVISNKATPTDIEGRPWTLIPGFAAHLSKRQIYDLAEMNIARQIETDYPVELAVSLDTEKVAAGVELIRNTAGYEYTGDLAGDGIKNYSENDIVACILDTGIKSDLLDLDEGQVIRWKDLMPANEQTPVDTAALPHGTWVAGVLAGQGNITPLYQGVAPGTALVVVRVGDTPASAINATRVIDGMEYCVDQKDQFNIRILSMSLGAQPDIFCSMSSDATAMATAANAAWNAGLVVVAAAGNGGPGTCTVLSPASASKVIAVGLMSDPLNPTCAIPNSGSTTHGWFIYSGSGRGKITGQIKPDILAPGHCIRTVNWNVTENTLCAGQGDYCDLGGTSLGTAFMSGVVSLMLHANLTGWTPGRANITPDQIKENLTLTAEKWGPTISSTPPYNYDYGAGRLRAFEAVSRVKTGTPGTGPAGPDHHFKIDSVGLLQTDSWTVTPTTEDYWLAATLIVPTAAELQENDLVARLRISPNNSPADGDCPTTTTTTSTSRQALISYDIESCGAASYDVDVTSLSGSGTYWLDFSVDAPAPT